MNIRTITIFMPGPPVTEQIDRAGRFLATAAEHFESKGVSVQTRRVAFSKPPLSGHDATLSSRKLEFYKSLELACETNHIDFCSLGAVRHPDDIRAIAGLILETSRLYAFAEVLPVDGEVNTSTMSAAADAIVRIGRESDAGLANFRFAAGFSIKPGGPFFPSSYHEGDEPYFAVGTQNSDVLIEAFRGAESLTEAEQRLGVRLSEAFSPIETAAKEIAEHGQVAFHGIDPSVVPILEERYSFAEAFNHLGVRIGEHGTLAVCALVTRAIRSLPLTAVGFRGIMLPALEDFGLAAAIDAGRLDMHKLLTYSSVCGVGLDMVPLPGNVTSDELVMVMTDIAALSRTLSKPLMARLLPIPNGKRGDLTALVHPYLCNTKILSAR
ncbi:MAG TPA: DUF711 family protein [Pyrinomonadaceae bacterium]